MGAAVRSGADMSTFASSLQPGAGDPIGSAMGAALRAGADMSQFASSLPAPPEPEPTPVAASAAPGGLSGGAPGGTSVGSVPGWLSDLIARNAPPELAGDPDFIRTVAAGAKAESGWDPNAVQKGGGGRGLFQFDLGGMGKPYAGNEQQLLGESGAQLQASQIVPLYAKAYQSAPAGLTGAEKASWVAAQAERPAGYTDPTSTARRNYASAYGEIGGDTGVLGRVGNAVGGAVQAVKGTAQQISQFGSSQLSNDEAYAACGPAAAVRFAQMFGRNPSLREATDLAATVGWTSASGMAGLASEKALMDKIGVATKAIGADVQAMAREAQTGNPVTISTPGHYFFADGYDPQSGAFHVGQSGLDLKGGSEWMTADQMQARMGAIQGALLADNPQVPTTSNAELSPLDRLGRFKDQAVRSITGEADNLSAAVSAVGNRPQPEFSSLDVDTSGRISPTTLGTTYKSTLLPGDQDVSAPTPVQPEQSPVDRLKSAFGDFVDSLGSSQAVRNITGTNPDQAAIEARYQQAQDAVRQATGSSVDIPGALPMLGGTSPYGIGSAGEQLSEERNRAIEQANPIRDVPFVGGLTTQIAQGVLDPTNLVLAGEPGAVRTAGRLAEEALANPEVQAALRTRQIGGGRPFAGAGPEGEDLATQVARAAARTPSFSELPPVPEGMVRLYRGEPLLGERATAQTNGPGRWFSSDPDIAREYGSTQFGENSRMAYVDVPADVAQQSRVHLEDAALGHHVIPTEYANQARPFTDRPIGIAQNVGAAAEPVTAPAGAQEKLQPSLRGAFEQPELKLPTYLPKEVQDLAQAAHQNIFDRSSSLDEVVQRAADRSGVDVERVQKAWGKEPDALRAIDEAMSQSGDRLGRLQENLKTTQKYGGDTTTALNDVVQELSRYQALQETAAKQLPKAGSLLDSLKPDTLTGKKAILEQVERMAKRADMSPDEWAQNLAKVDMSDPERVANLAQITRNYTFGDKLQAIWYFNLLSNPLTHIRNIASNTAMATSAPVETLGASVLDWPARKLLGDTGPRQRYAGESLAQVQGLVHSLADGSALKAGSEALKYGAPSDLGGEITRLAKEPFAGTKLEALGYTGRLLEAEDQFSRGVNSTMSLRAQAYRIAKQEGKSGEAFKDRVAELLSKPSEAMLDTAKSEAAYRTLQNENPIGSAANQLADKLPLGIGNILVPFRRTPINAAQYILERSPFGAVGIAKDFRTAAGRQALREAGSGELADRMSRAAIGSAVMYGLAQYAASGDVMTGRAPDDPTERDQWQRTGKTPYSFKNPLDGRWYSYQSLQPFATLFGTAADVADAAKRGQIKDPSDVGSIATVASMAMARGLLDQQWTQGLSDALDLLSNGDPDPGKRITRIGAQYLGSAVPGSGMLRGLARMTDNVVRDPADYGLEGLEQGVAANLPIEGVRHILELSGANTDWLPQVPGKRDAFGFETTRAATGLGALLNPVTISQDTSDDPVETELARLAKNPDFNAEPSFVDKNITIGNDRLRLPVELDENQRRKYQEQSGQLAYALLAEEVQSKGWDALPDTEKVKRIRDVYSRSREVARALMTPELLGQGIQGFGQQLRRQEAVRVPARTSAAVPEEGDEES